MTRFLAVALVVLVGCNSGEDLEASRIDLGDVSLVPPPGWQMAERGSTTRVWTPRENARAESVTVVIGPRFLGGAERAFALARQAQGTLLDARVTGSERITSPSGFPGLRLDVRFRPTSRVDELYQRSHAVLFVEDDAGGYPVHVIYTAAKPDPRRSPLERIVDTIEKGA